MAKTTKTKTASGGSGGKTQKGPGPKLAKKTSPKKSKATQTSKFKRSLKVELTPAEVREAADLMANTVQVKAELLNDKKSINDEFKAKISAADATIVEASNKVRNKYEYRDVNCESVLYFKKNQFVVARLDTGDIIEDRAMTPTERESQTLFDEGK